MPPGKLTGLQAVDMMQGLAEQAGAHLWMDLEAFVFRDDGALVPRPIADIVADLNRYPSFEKVLCYQFPGLMTAPWQQPRRGGEAAVRLYLDYQKHIRSLEGNHVRDTSRGPN